MQVLGDEELSVIFEYMTQHHQVADLEQVLNSQASSGLSAKAEQAEKPAKEQPAPEAKKEAGAAKETNVESEKPAQPTSTKVKQVHRIDTRGTGDVNLAKYDDHVDKLVDAKAERMESRGQKKQKLTKKSDQRSKPFGNKRRQEEAGEDEAPAASAADRGTARRFRSRS